MVKEWKREENGQREKERGWWGEGECGEGRRNEDGEEKDWGIGGRMNVLKKKREEDEGEKNSDMQEKEYGKKRNV